MFWEVNDTLFGYMPNYPKIPLPKLAKEPKILFRSPFLMKKLALGNDFFEIEPKSSFFQPKKQSKY